MPDQCLSAWIVFCSSIGRHESSAAFHVDINPVQLGRSSTAYLKRLDLCRREPPRESTEYCQFPKMIESAIC